MILKSLLNGKCYKLIKLIPGMLIGLVGKPNVGKSTFFKAATLAEVEIGDRPFVTIKANHGVGYVRVECLEKEFDTKCNPQKGFCINGERFVPIEIMDVAGLVPGASEGKGLGNQFLDELRTADCFVHIVDISGTTDLEGKPVKNHDPIKDVEFLEFELDLWYYNIFMKVWKSFARKTDMEKQKISEAIAKQFSGLKVTVEQVKETLRSVTLPEKISMWSDDEIKVFVKHLRKISKPTIIAANKIDLENGKENLEKLIEKYNDLVIIPCSSDCELALRQAAKTNLIDYIPGDSHFKVLDSISDKQKQGLEKIKTTVLDSFGKTGVQEVLNTAVFDLLGYIAVFPASATKHADSKGNVLPDCFLLPPGSTALDFAYYLHTDFGKNFIKAIDARTKKAVGKDYVIKHRDGLEIITR